MSVTITVHGDTPSPGVQLLVDQARRLEGTWVEMEATEGDTHTLEMVRVEKPTEALPFEYKHPPP